MRFASGSGVVGAFFLWKDGSDAVDAFWNELDFEDLGIDCHLQTNALFGAPAVGHEQTRPVAGNLCTTYHGGAPSSGSGGAGAGGAGGARPTATPSNGSGCGCRLDDRSDGGAGFTGIGLLGLFLLRRRRSRRA